MLRIRLRRMGNRNRPFYRVVVSDGRKAPTARAVEELGHYDPSSKIEKFRIDRQRVDYWVGNGARLSATMKRLLNETSGAPA